MYLSLHCHHQNDFCIKMGSDESPEPPLDRHMLVFTGKCFPSTGKKYSRRYQVPAETEYFV